MGRWIRRHRSSGGSREVTDGNSHVIFEAAMKSIVGKPVLIDKLDAELVPKVVEAIVADNERAKKAKEARRARKKAKRKAPPAADAD